MTKEDTIKTLERDNARLSAELEVKGKEFEEKRTQM